MRCPDCNKMVSYGDPTTEVSDEQISAQREEDGSFSGEVTCNVRLVLPCADCNTELKETNFDITMPFVHKCKEGTEIKEEDEGEDFELSIDEPEGTDRYQSTDPKTGKSIPHRFRKHFFGVDVHADIKCPHCGEDFDVSGSDECQASGMDELV